MKNQDSLKDFLSSRTQARPEVWVRRSEKTPLISVIVNSFNHANWILECLVAIEGQTLIEELEVIVGVEQSTDGTLSQALEWQRTTKVPSTVVVDVPGQNNIARFGKRSGVYNMSYCMTYVRGVYIARCDGDDVWLSPKKLEIQLRAMLEVDAVISWFRTSNVMVAVEQLESRWKTITPLDLILKNEVGPCASTVLWRSESFDAADLVACHQSCFADMIINHSVLSGGGKGILGAGRFSYRRVHSGGLWSGLSWRERRAQTLSSVLVLSQHFGYVETVWSGKEQLSYIQSSMEYPNTKEVVVDLKNRILSRFIR